MRIPMTTNGLLQIALFIALLVALARPLGSYMAWVYETKPFGIERLIYRVTGARPSLALIPSVIVPVGETGFSAEKPVYQLNAMAEWTLRNGWGIGALAGYLNGPSGGDRYGQETLGVSLGRSLPSPQWSAYGEAVHVITNLSGASDSSFLGGGVKYLISNDAQFDLSFDRGVTSDSPDWLLGLGFSARF